MITEEQVREQLKTVIDPELKVNVVDLGLVYKVECQMLNAKCQIKILMTLTTSGCPLAGMFEALVKHALGKIPGVEAEKDVEVELTFDPPWTTDMMSEAAKAELGF